MKTEFKDVAHLYLGCKLKCSQVFYPESNSKDKDGNLILSPSLFADFGEKTFSIGYFKPILRPLSDMKEDEEDAWTDLYVSSQDNRIKAANRTLFLLQQGFDLFGLIESGQAIDATKLPNHPH